MALSVPRVAATRVGGSRRAAAAAVNRPVPRHPRLRVDRRLPITCHSHDADSSSVSASTSGPDSTDSPHQQTHTHHLNLDDDTLVTRETTSSGSTTSSSRVKRKAESTDAVASFLSRRFGLAGGLAWLGFLAIGTLGEQVKTRMEVAAEKNGTQEVSGAEVVTPSGLTYRDLRIGGGQAPIRSYLVVLDYVAKANGEVFDDTKARGKPIVFIYGSRPFSAALCPGVEEALSTMRAGGRRTVKVPAALGFGERGAVLRPTEHVPDKQGIVPPGADVEYDLELVRVSIPPS